MLVAECKISESETNLKALSIVRGEVKKLEEIIEARRVELKKRADDSGLLSTFLNPHQSSTIPVVMAPTSGGGSVVGGDGGCGDGKGNSSISSLANNSVRKPDPVMLQSPANETRQKSGLVYGVLCALAFAAAGYLYAYHTQRSCSVDEFRFTH
jgi:hypothetical protein